MKLSVEVRYALVAAIIIAFFLLMGRVAVEYDRAVDITKALLAITAAGLVFYEQHRVGMWRPIAERWKKFVGITLAIASIVAYFHGFRLGYAKYYHRHDQYHYYLGAKYFPEMGYDGLYRCTVIAQDELGTVRNSDLTQGPIGVVEMSKEARASDRKIRNLGGDNLLMHTGDVLAHPETCKASFSPERWEEFKNDIRFFRISAENKGYFNGMQEDHGYNPPPVWMILGRLFAGLAPAGSVHFTFLGGGLVYLQLLAWIDNFFLLGTFVALYWAFGWRVFAVAAIFWGCQASAPSLWTEGAFLRQDWLFFLIMAACLARKQHYKLAGAAMVTTGLLRIFPGLTVIGWLAVVFWQLVRHRRLTRPQTQMLIGGVAAAAILIPLSLIACGASSMSDAVSRPKASLVAGKDTYQQFYRHTLEIHDRTPLTNHMGLRVLISHQIGSGPESSGRMKYIKDDKLLDPFEVWMRKRNERYDHYKYVAYGITALSLAFFLYVARRIKSMWIAQCLGQIFIILMSQLTSYYYVFMILTAPLTRVKRSLEAPLFGFAALTQFVFMTFYWNDDRYTALTLISLLFCYALLAVFAGPELVARFRRGDSDSRSQ